VILYIYPGQFGHRGLTAKISRPASFLRRIENFTASRNLFSCFVVPQKGMTVWTGMCENIKGKPPYKGACLLKFGIFAVLFFYI